MVKFYGADGFMISTLHSPFFANENNLLVKYIYFYMIDINSEDELQWNND